MKGDVQVIYKTLSALQIYAKHCILCRSRSAAAAFAFRYSKLHSNQNIIWDSFLSFPSSELSKREVVIEQRYFHHLLLKQAVQEH